METASLKSLAAVPPSTLGRYEVLGSLAKGGMASVYLGRHSGGSGFQRLYAIKVLHPHLAEDADFVNMLLDEARIAARLHHPNVVPVVDLGTQDGLHYIVMEYVEGASLSALLAKNRELRSPRLIVPILLDMLAGLHAAHSLTDDDGHPLNLVHRDVSPQNVMVGVDGTARIVDFGIAKAEARIASTRPGELKGKFAYMAPEQVRQAHAVDARVDVFAAGVLAWSALTAVRLFLADNDAETINNILTMPVPKPSSAGLAPPAILDDVILRALERDPQKRFASAAQMEDALQAVASTAGLIGTKREVAEWVATSYAEELSQRRRVVRAATGQNSSRDVTAPSSSLTPAFSGTRPVPPSRADTPARNAPIEIEDIAVTFANAELPKKKNVGRLALAIGGVVLLLGVGIGLGVKFAGNHDSGATMSSAVLTNAPPPSVAKTDTAPAPRPVDSSATTTNATSTNATTSTTPVATPPVSAVAHANVAPHVDTFVRPNAWRAPPPPPAKSAAPVATAAAATPAAEPRKKAWDNDSPVPP